jgi:ribosomal protein S18 acetylase RimI-like enzyme
MRCILIQDKEAVLSLCSSFIDRLDHHPYTVPCWRKFKAFVLLLSFSENNENESKPNARDSNVDQDSMPSIGPSVSVLEIGSEGSVVATRKGLPTGLGSHTFLGYMAFAYSPLSGLPMHREGNGAAGSEVSTEAYLMSFLVLPTLRGKGFGKRLLSVGLALSRSHFNAKRIRLHVMDATSAEKEYQSTSTTTTTTAMATHLYRSTGFEVRRRIPNYYGKGQDGLEMVLHLADVWEGVAQGASRKRGRCD